MNIIDDYVKVIYLNKVLIKKTKILRMREENQINYLIKKKKKKPNFLVVFNIKKFKNILIFKKINEIFGFS